MKSPEQNPPDEVLVAQIQKGDHEAFEKLFRSYYEELCAFVDSRIGDLRGSDDIVQNVFLSLWRRRKDLAIRSTVRAYLFGAARNESISHRERRKRQTEDNEVRRKHWERVRSWSNPNPVDEIERDELRHVIRESIAALPERRREVYILSRQHGLTYKEIARVMDISPKTVDNQMVEALRFLRKRIRSRSSRAPQ